MMSAMRIRTPLRACAAVVVSVALTACVRIETPEPTWPSPSPAVLERDALAAPHAQVQAALEGAIATPLAALESAVLPDLLAGIGPEYVAYPDADGDASPDGDLEGAVTEALDASLAAATTASDPDVRAWGVSAALVHAFGLWLDERPEGVAERAFPALGADAFAMPAASAVDADAVRALSRRHDDARCLLDQIAMRTADAEQADAIARRDIESARSDALQALAGGVDDRTAICSVPLDAIEDADARARSVREAQIALGDAYAAIAVTAPAADMEWLLDGAFDAYAAAATTPGWTTADMPTTPGLSPLP